MAGESQNIIRLLVAESFELMRMGLRSLLQDHASIHLVAETHCIEEMLDLVLQYKPDVVLFDLQLNGGNCADYISKLLNMHPQCKVLAFSPNTDKEICLQSFRFGAVGIVNKHHSSELLLKAIFSIHAGQIWFDRQITKLLLRGQDADEHDSEKHNSNNQLPLSRLSESERQVAYLACKGLSAKEISAHLFITEKTVRNQLSIVYKKIGVKKQVELCLKAPEYNYFKVSYMFGTFDSEESGK